MAAFSSVSRVQNFELLSKTLCKLCRAPFLGLDLSSCTIFILYLFKFVLFCFIHRMQALLLTFGRLDAYSWRCGTVKDRHVF